MDIALQSPEAAASPVTIRPVTAAQAAQSGLGFDGSTGSVIETVTGEERQILVGLGDPPHRLDTIQAAAASGLARVAALKAPAAQLALDDLTPDIAREFVIATSLAAYRRDTRKTSRPRAFPERLGVTGMAEASLDEARMTAEAVAFARDLVNAPGNELDPETFAELIRGLGRDGLEIEIVGPDALAERGFGAMCAVGRGSAKGSYLAVMRWNGGAPDAAPLALVGKGLTFDSGGLNLKLTSKMWLMKFDMAGAAAVCATMQLIARRGARANVVGLVGLSENLVDALAMRPGDVVTSLSGKTIEVVDTDAEGRLVLADVLWHAAHAYRPATIVDLATLTGAIIATLGLERAGLMSNDDRLAQTLLDLGDACGEPLWRLPLGAEYQKLLTSPIADLINLAPAAWGDSPGAGSVTAGQFLSNFVPAGIPWAHLDIAGTAWAHGARPATPEGGTGFGVRLLDEWIRRAEG